MPEEIPERLRDALERRDAAALERLLSSAVRLVLDTGDDEGRTIQRRRQVIPFLLSHASTHRSLRITVETVNGMPGIVLRAKRGTALGVLVLSVRRRAVTDIWMVAAPDKLTRWSGDDASEEKETRGRS
ncbi:hypothetical protein ACFPJ4_12070 [Lysinimonas soli]|uniref:Nuclear transport factor 2 family protein n=1 Tax=Lysinimonas soli TaxID=1074233 RepID=A0ABW0NS99_9MICO